MLNISNTRAFNNHFQVAATKVEKSTAERDEQQANANIRLAYKDLAEEDFDPAWPDNELLDRAHSSLSGIALLKPHCAEKGFLEIDPAECVEAAKSAEGGEDREKLAAILRENTLWTEACQLVPSAENQERLKTLAKERQAALQGTQGDLFRQLYAVSEQIISADSWSDKTLCPTCDRSGPDSVLDKVRDKITSFDEVSKSSSLLAEDWVANGWSGLSKLEEIALKDDEQGKLAALGPKGAAGALSYTDAEALAAWARELGHRGEAKIANLEEQREQLEKALPPKLTAVVEKVEAARRLQSAIRARRAAKTQSATVQLTIDRIEHVKGFLDSATSTYATAESAAAARRLQAIEPAAKTIFKAIMGDEVVPALKKRPGTEELSLTLAQFWSLENVSAQALLSESYRNAFAISVYLAAASLYGGAAKFMVLDDVTSSFDCGHQLFLMNVIRHQFARPGDPNGPQVIVLSHDATLEKYFNTAANEGGWYHQRIEGTARTAVLPQSGAVNKVRDSTLALLAAGNVDDAGPRIRMYLEYKLHEVIAKVGIPVPSTIVFHDDKQLAKTMIDAIKAQVQLHKAAGTLVLEPGQEQGLSTSLATIVGNYLSHWSTGQTQTFTAPLLTNVMAAIDAFADSFRFEHPAGSGQFRYYRSLSQKT